MGERNNNELLVVVEAFVVADDEEIRARADRDGRNGPGGGTDDG